MNFSFDHFRWFCCFRIYKIDCSSLHTAPTIFRIWHYKSTLVFDHFGWGGGQEQNGQWPFLTKCFFPDLPNNTLCHLHVYDARIHDAGIQSMTHVSKLHVSMMHVAYSKFVDLRTGLVHILMILVLDPDACRSLWCGNFWYHHRVACCFSLIIK